ncbi:DUF397 domain-containing protein [Lipingzhangella halophila]|uniref:DUF397 domain-containing protein n=1 Tax=Lipingzhangella halophila TaxID=1783352 RepID=UPI0035E418AB
MVLPRTHWPDHPPPPYNQPKKTSVVRDTRHRDHGHLDFTLTAWTTFLHALKTGHL